MAHKRALLCVHGVQGSPADAVQLLVERGFLVCELFAEDATHAKIDKSKALLRG